MYSALVMFDLNWWIFSFIYTIIVWLWLVCTSDFQFLRPATAGQWCAREGFEICFVASRESLVAPRSHACCFCLFRASPCAPNHVAGPRARRCCCCCCTGTFFIAFSAAMLAARKRAVPCMSERERDQLRLLVVEVTVGTHTHKRNSTFICFFVVSVMRKCKFR